MTELEYLKILLKKKKEDEIDNFYHCIFIQLENLEAENKKLKVQIENIEKDNAILKDKCNCYLKNFNIDEDIIIGEQEEISRLQRLTTELTNTVSEKNLLIEKMKNCPNCNLYDCTVNCVHTKCKYQYSEMCRDENMNDKWELSD